MVLLDTTNKYRTGLSDKSYYNTFSHDLDVFESFKKIPVSTNCPISTNQSEDNLLNRSFKIRKLDFYKENSFESYICHLPGKKKLFKIYFKKMLSKI